MGNINKNEVCDNRPVGFFDSGVGGLTVLNRVQKVIPNEKYIYFGDTKNMPYGEKTETQLIEFADNIFKFFERNGVKVVVMACNTTSAIVYEKLKNNYNFKIYPIVQSVAKVFANLNIQRIGIFATPATINSHIYSKEISKYNKNIEVFELACPEWVKIVEENRENEPESDKLIKIYLDKMMLNKPDKIVLGCTHYPFLINNLKKFLPESTFIDPAIDFANIIKADLAKNNLLSNQTTPEFEFYVSSNPKNFKHSGQMFFNLQSSIIKIHKF